MRGTCKGAIATIEHSILVRFLLSLSSLVASHTGSCTACVQATTSHTENVTVHMITKSAHTLTATVHGVSVESHMDDATFLMKATTAHRAPLAVN